MPTCKRCGERAEYGLELMTERTIIVQSKVDEICVSPEREYMWLHTIDEGEGYPKRIFRGGNEESCRICREAGELIEDDNGRLVHQDCLIDEAIEWARDSDV